MSQILNLSAKRVIMADVDDTICESIQPISPEMAREIERLCSKGKIFAFISGSTAPDVLKQMYPHLKADTHVLGTSGTHYFQVKNGQPTEIYREAFSKEERDELKMVLKALKDEYKIVSMTDEDDQIQDRGCQLTFSAIGRHAPPEAKRSFDQDRTKRQVWVEFVKARLSGRYAIGIGGTTSIDITRAGVDKEWGIRKFASHNGLDLKDIVFFGDQIKPGGNDFPATRAVDCVPVTGIEDTLQKFRQL